MPSPLLLKKSVKQFDGFFFPLVYNLSIYLCGGQILMPQKFAGCINIGPLGEQEGGKTVPGAVETYFFDNSCILRPLTDNAIGRSR